jgi:hypothetical protein
MKIISFVLLAIFSVKGFSQIRTLEFFVSQAQRNAPLIKDYRSQYLITQLDSSLLRASNRLQVNGISNNVYAPVFNGFGYDQALTNGGTLSAMIQASKTFYSRGNLSSQFQMIRYQGQSLSNTALTVEQDLKRTIISQYITTYGDMLTAYFNKEVFEMMKKEEELLKKLTERNVYKQADYLTFYVSLQQQELTYRQSEIQYKNDYATLNYLSGIIDTAAVPLEDPHLEPQPLPSINTSMFYQKFIIDSLNFLNQRAVINYSYKPRLSVLGDAGYNSSLVLQPYRNFGVSFSVNLTVPIYDGRQRQFKYQKIAISERTRQSNKSFFLNQYYQQIAQLNQQLELLDNLNPQINEQIKYSYTLIAVNEKLLQTGDVKIADYMISINVYLNAKNLLNQNHVSRLQIINQLNYWNR